MEAVGCQTILYKFSLTFSGTATLIGHSGLSRIWVQGLLPGRIPRAATSLLSSHQVKVKGRTEQQTDSALASSWIQFVDHCRTCRRKNKNKKGYPGIYLP